MMAVFPVHYRAFGRRDLSTRTVYSYIVCLFGIQLKTSTEDEKIVRDLDSISRNYERNSLGGLKDDHTFTI